MKVSIILVMLLSFSNFSFAALDLRPGLWKVKMRMETQGKEVNPMAHIQQAMAKLSPEQRKQMQMMMDQMGKKNGKNTDSIFSNLESMAKGEGIKVCYTKESLLKDESLAAQGSENCQHTDLKRTSKKVEMSFVCKDGSKGHSEWTIKSEKSYQGVMDITRQDGRSGKMYFEGQFAETDCGKVLPLHNS